MPRSCGTLWSLASAQESKRCRQRTRLLSITSFSVRSNSVKAIQLLAVQMTDMEQPSFNNLKGGAADAPLAASTSPLYSRHGLQ